MTKRHCSIPETVANNRLLAEYGTVENGLYTYKEGWDDKRIAQTVAADLNQQHAAKVRMECFGKLQVHWRSSASHDHSAEIAALHTASTDAGDTLSQHDAAIAELTRRLDVLADLHAKLCDSLAVNRVCSVQHLAGKPPLRAVVR